MPPGTQTRPTRRRVERAKNKRRSKFPKNALRFVERGIPIVPVAEDKAPLTENGFMNASTDRKKIREWAKQFPNANIGVPTGSASGFVVIDLDRKGGVDGVKSFKDLCHRLDIKIPKTYKIRTPSGGQHLFFVTKHAGLIRCSASRLGPGIDVRGEGGYVVAEGSSIDGKRYRCVSGSLDDIAILPGALRREIKRAKKRRRGSPGNGERTYPEGKRNDSLFRDACALRASGKPYEKVAELARHLNQSTCVPPLDDDEVVGIVDSAFRYKTAEQADQASGKITPSDVAFSDLFIEQHSKHVRYCEQGWLIWDGVRWSHDDHGQVQEMGKQTARSILDLSKEEPDVERASKLARWGANVLQKPRIDAGTSLACSNPKIRIKTSELDADPLLLNVLNGTIDLRTGELRPHRRGDLITRVCPVDYDESAECPRWEAFLDTIFEGSKSLIDFVQRAVGYSLTGLTNEHCLFICHGGGDNGKTVLLETIGQVAADYARASSIETFMARGNRGGIPNDIARLAGVRLVTVGETPQHGAFNESLVKDLTGGDTITARFLHREFFDFRPQFKLWIRANHKPRIKGTDHGIWRRIRLIPFGVTIPKKEQDPYLRDKLRGELPGILAWKVQGCLAWQKHGLKPPLEVRRATKSYKSDQDVLGTYLKERVRSAAESCYIKAHPLYKDYVEWCEESGERPEPEKDFSAAMIERGFEKKRKKSGWRYLGINFKT